MNVDPLKPGGGDRSPLPVLLLVVAAAVLAAQSQVWASALGTAAAVYTVLAGGNQNRRS
ncbi:hypothetical protein ABZ636_31305 [Streptomyces sp. NPDC007251]|uniref:hypothetical protein n=1 Tax=Streptomyces sp. NPDC007251 TaxID=3154483 RepID=UPI0033EA0DF5